MNSKNAKRVIDKKFWEEILEYTKNYFEKLEDKTITYTIPSFGLTKNEIWGILLPHILGIQWACESHCVNAKYDIDLHEKEFDLKIVFNR